jgi:hypothetical protein
MMAAFCRLAHLPAAIGECRLGLVPARALAWRERTTVRERERSVGEHVSFPLVFPMIFLWRGRMLYHAGPRGTDAAGSRRGGTHAQLER